MTRASPGASSTVTRASPGISTVTRARLSRTIGSTQKRRLLARMMMLSHGAGQGGSTSFAQGGSSGFAQGGSSSFAPALDGRSRENPGDESFMSGHSGSFGGSGEVKVGLDEGVLGNMSQCRDEEGEMELEEVDDGGDGWYEKAMEIIRQDALIQEQVLAATLL